MRFLVLWEILSLLLLSHRMIAMSFDISSNDAVNLNLDRIESWTPDDGNVVQVPAAPLITADQIQDYCSNPTRRRSRLKRGKTFCDLPQLRLTLPQTENLLNPFSQKTTPAAGSTPTTEGNKLEQPVIHLEQLMKLSDKEKCRRYDETGEDIPICSPGIPAIDSPSPWVIPCHACK